MCEKCCMHHIVFLSIHIHSYHSWTHKQPRKKKLVAYWHIRNKQRNTLTHTKHKHETADSRVHTNKKPNWSVVDKKKDTQQRQQSASERRRAKAKNNNNTSITNQNSVSAGNSIHRETRIRKQTTFLSIYFFFFVSFFFLDDIDDDDEMVLETHCLEYAKWNMRATTTIPTNIVEYILW